MVRPLGNLLLIEQVKNDLVATDSGILLGDERAPQSIKAKVLAIGPEVNDIKVDAVILVSQFSPVEAREKVTDKTLICSADDVLAVIE